MIEDKDFEWADFCKELILEFIPKHKKEKQCEKFKKKFQNLNKWWSI